MKKQSIGRPIIEPSPDWWNRPLIGVIGIIGHKEITINDYNAIVGGNNDANNDAAVGSVGDNSTSFSSIEAYSNTDSYRISGNNGENILSSTDNDVDQGTVL